jgi:hypothetical protein
MLLHKSNINVAIAVILGCMMSLYDLRGPKYKNSWKKGVAPDKVLWWNFVYPNFSKTMDPNRPKKRNKPSRPGRLYSFLARYLIIIFEMESADRLESEAE